ncbi:MAG: hypothetical protein GX234_11745 [Clostridiales bacterium]|nr:hypothetical protein [Clostridiales bacterium]
MGGAYKYLKIAYSLLMKDSSKIIYFPCKHEEDYGDYYQEHTTGGNFGFGEVCGIG